MHWLLPVGTILAALAVGVVSPGPSFVLVARTAVARSRRDGIATAFGMGLGGVIFATLALLGLIALFAAVPWLFLALKIGGALYLVYLGFLTWRAARRSLTVAADAPGDSPATAGASFRRGLLTQLSNPKTAVVYGSVFAALLPPHLPLWVDMLLPVAIFILETSWYCIVAIALSSPLARAAYLDWKAAIDRLAGGVMTLLGIKLLLGASR